MKKRGNRIAVLLLSSFVVLSVCACGGQKDAAQIAGDSAGTETAAGAENGTEGGSAAEAQEPAVITIYSTNDIHGVVEESADDGVIGLAQIAGIAASTDNAILLDAGDATQGAGFATVDNGAYVIEVMNAAGYKAMAAGNHEFDYGAEALIANAEKAQFPILSANTLKDGEVLLDGHTIVEAAQYRIGIVGITTALTATSTNPEKLEGITFEDELEAARSEIKEIADSVDAIVLLTHLGDNPLATTVTSQNLLEGLSEEELEKVAAVIDGHSHTVEETVVGSVPIIQTGAHNTGLGAVTLSFDGKGGFTSAGEVWDYAEASAFALNEDGETAKAAVIAAYDSCLAEIDPILSEKVARTGAPVWGGYIYYDYAEPRIVETTMGDLVTDAFRYYGQIFADNNALPLPVIGVENGGGISATLPYGIVTRGDILNAFNHGNTVDVIKVCPSQIYTALELGLTMTGQEDTGRLISEKPSGSFLQVSGITYAYDPAGEEGNKVVSVTLEDGTELARDDEETELLVVTNNYVTTFDGFSSAMKFGELGGEDAIVMDYILHLTNDGADTLTIDRTADRITVAGDKSPAAYDVVIPVQATEGAAYDFAGTEFEIVIDNEAPEKVICEKDGLHLTVSKGAHTFYLAESVDGVPVYTNNYSGSGTVTTADGYYHLYFTVDPETLK